MVLTGGATDWRDLPIPGRELDGIHQAMEYLPWANRVQNGDPVVGDDGEPPITAKGKKVVIIGGGDTGADCLGTAHRQGAASVHQFEIMPRPPEERADVDAVAHLPADVPGGLGARRGRRAGLLGQHRGVRRRSTATSSALKVHEVQMQDGKFVKVDGSDFDLDADLVLLAMGFVGPGEAGSADRSERRDDRPRQRRPQRRLPDLGAGRLRRR